MNKPLTFAFAAVVLSLGALAASRAENFPDRPIKVVVAYPVGGPTDTVGRVATQGLAAEIGQTVFVENIAGAGGRMGARDVARALPDGYTLLLGGTNDNAITPALYKNVEYDPVKDFVPVAALANDSNAIVVNPSLPVHSLAELAAYAKANPGKLTSGSTVGIAPHLLLELFRVRMGVEIVFVPYKGAAPAIADVLGNHIQVHASAKSVLLPLIQAGRLRALAVSSAVRWPELPDVPTLRESGIDGFPTSVMFAIMAPAATPPDVIGKINAAENTVLKSPQTQTAIAKLGLETRVLSPKELAAVLTQEAGQWQAVAHETGIHLD